MFFFSLLYRGKETTFSPSLLLLPFSHFLAWWSSCYGNKWPQKELQIKEGKCLEFPGCKITLFIQHLICLSSHSPYIFIQSIKNTQCERTLKIHRKEVSSFLMVNEVRESPKYYPCSFFMTHFNMKLPDLTSSYTHTLITTVCIFQNTHTHIQSQPK